MLPNPIGLLPIVLIIPLIYSMLWKREGIRITSLLLISGIIITLLYPVLIPNDFGGIGYFAAKVVLFVFIPLLIIGTDLTQVGISKKNLSRSMLLGLVAAVINIFVTLLVSSANGLNIVWGLVMFAESFTEEFYFRGVLLLYLLKKTSVKIAFLTSILGFILIHPQHFTSLFIISTITQAVLLAIITYKTKNVSGAWIAHGLNRVMPGIINTIICNCANPLFWALHN